MPRFNGDSDYSNSNADSIYYDSNKEDDDTMVDSKVTNDSTTK